MSAAMSIGQGIAATISNYTAASASYEAAMFNADVARQEAAAAIAAGQLKQKQISRQERKMWGQQSAVLGAAGIGQTGSPLETMIDTQAEFEKSIANEGWNAQVQATAKENEARQYEFQAQQAHKAKVMALWFGPFNTAGGLSGMISTARSGGNAWQILNGEIGSKEGSTFSTGGGMGFGGSGASGGASGATINPSDYKLGTGLF